MTNPRFGARLSGATVLAAFAVATALTGGAATATAAPSSPTTTTTLASSVAACDAVQSNARVRAGKQGVDPNDLSRAQTAKAEKTFDTKLTEAGLSKLTTKLPVGLVKVPVHYHVIVKDDGTGAPTKAQLAAQISVLNKAYGGASSRADAKTVFQFSMKSVDVTRNSDWYDWTIDTESDDVNAKKALHVGGKKDLNVYVTGLGNGLLGYSSFPFDGGPTYEDGVVILNGSLPGGDVVPYNEGDTLTHEVGHWLGLFHTFENGCAAPGDGVADTPYQADGDNIFYCNESDDTCPATGKDPVHNFMSYGDDPCLDRFSKGQALRMGLAWLAFRSGLKF